MTSLGNHPIRTFFVAASTAVLVGAASCGAPAPQTGHPYPELKVCGTIGAHPVRVPDDQCVSPLSPYVWYVGKSADLDYDDYTPVGSRLDDDYLGYQPRPVIVAPSPTKKPIVKPTPRLSVRPAPTPRVR